MELHIIKYCAEECMRQGSGELSVYDMVNAWEWAQTKSEYCPKCVSSKSEVHDRVVEPITLDFIEHLGKLVEPEDNKNGFRTIPIGVNDPNLGWIEKSDWQLVPDLLDRLIESYYDGNLVPIITPVPNTDWHKVERGHKLSKSAEDQFYYEYENIHPFRDGNGRTGKILYNYLCGTLDNPIMPPNFWNVYNP